MCDRRPDQRAHACGFVAELALALRRELVIATPRIVIARVRRRRLAAGASHAEVEELLTANAKLTPLAALALFDDRDRGGDVLPRLNRFGPWAGDVFKECREGAHKGIDGDPMQIIRDAEKLTTKILELR